jgi:hypothetical protein
MQNQGLLEDFRQALPDFSAEDLVGSPYCVRRYVVDEHLGGPAGLATAREMLAQRGIRLVLDFVPNHVAPDHPWASTHSEYFIQGLVTVHTPGSNEGATWWARWASRALVRKAKTLRPC